MNKGFVQVYCCLLYTSLPAQILKAVIGLAVAITLQNGLKLVLGTTLFAHCIRYFILVIWVIVLYPMIFKRFIKK